MADQEHIAILMQGAEVWNQWRTNHPEIRPDLSSADFSLANLHKVDLHGTNLIRANLISTNLIGAVLNQANLSRACLNGASLYRASLNRATLVGASLREVSLIDADLTRADLRGADLSYAVVGLTNLGGVDLSAVKGLDLVDHRWTPSRILCKRYAGSAWQRSITQNTRWCPLHISRTTLYRSLKEKL